MRDGLKKFTNLQDANVINLAATIDHTLLRPEQSTRQRIEQLCSEAQRYGFASVCVLPRWVPLAAELLYNTPVAVCSVVGFPLGGNLTLTKQSEAAHLITAGAQELDMVMDIAALKSGDDRAVLDDIRAVVETAHPHGVIVKVIIECSVLDEHEKVRAAELVSTAEADFIKTSTGFSTHGATVEDVRLLRRVVAPSVKVKAAGGIRTRQQALALIEAGAERIGTSAGVAIVSDTGVESSALY